jgi:hypothetical protein
MSISRDNGFVAGRDAAERRIPPEAAAFGKSTHAWNLAAVAHVPPNELKAM